MRMMCIMAVVESHLGICMRLPETAAGKVYRLTIGRRPWGLSDKIGLRGRPEKRSSLRPILRESVFPEDSIGIKFYFQTCSLVEYAGTFRE